MQAQTNTDFSQGSVSSNIVRLAVPMTLAQLVNVLYNIIDRIYIGRIGADATNALTGLGVCFPIITMILAFSNLVGMGGAPLFSMRRGAGEPEEAEAILGNCFSLLLGIGVSLTVFGLLIRRPLLLALGASETTLPYAMSYITIYLFGTIFVMLSLGLNQFINAQGFGTTGMLTVIIGAVLNLILDPIFIFVLHMGVRGAACATVLSQFVSALWTLRFLTGSKTLLRIRRQHLHPHKQRVQKILTLGLAGFTMNVTNSLVQVACNSTLQIFGGDLYVGVMTVLNSVREIIMLPVNGVTSSAQPVISFNYGAALLERVRKAIVFFDGTVDRLFVACMGIDLSVPSTISLHLQYRSEIACRRRAVDSFVFFFRFLLHGASVFRPIGFHRAGQIASGNFLFHLSKRHRRHSADASPAALCRAWRQRCLSCRADFQSARRRRQLFDHVPDRIPQTKKTSLIQKRIRLVFVYSSITSKSSGTYRLPLKYG